MLTQAIDPRYFEQKAALIRTQAATVLKKWGLLPRFKRWRLTQDPDTGVVVLFGILNNRYIATHTSTPYAHYFDPRLLHDLANQLQVQVVSCNSDGLRYAFILNRGRIDILPTHIDYPFVDGDRLVARVVYEAKLMRAATEPPMTPAPLDVDDRALVDRGVGAFLKVFDDIKRRDDAAAAQNPPNIIVIDEDAFNQRIAEHEANRQLRQRT